MTSPHNSSRVPHSPLEAYLSLKSTGSKYILASDLHAHAAVLQGVLEQAVIEKPKAVIFAGDTIGHTSENNCVLETLMKKEYRDIPLISIMGNHCYYALNPRINTTTGKAQRFDILQEPLNDNSIAYLRSLPHSYTTEDAFLHVAHGTFSKEIRYSIDTNLYMDQNEYEETLAKAMYYLFSNHFSIGVLGHTHQPGIAFVQKRDARSTKSNDILSSLRVYAYEELFHPEGKKQRIFRWNPQHEIALINPGSVTLSEPGSAAYVVLEYNSRMCRAEFKSIALPTTSVNAIEVFDDASGALFGLSESEEFTLTEEEYPI